MIEIKDSTKVVGKNLKLMIWGATGTRKTESVLRNFPHVLVFDSEGNVEQCVGVPEIKPFRYIQSKDTREALEIIDQVSNGKILMQDGAKVETLCFDSASVLWSVQQEVASSLAEKRALKYNRDATTATTTQIDWTVAKRPLKNLLTKLNNSGIKYVILIAREKDLYADLPGNELKKIGVQPDVVKGADYEMNLVLHTVADGDKWYCEVTKPQGAIGQDMPKGKKFDRFPFDLIAKQTSGKTSVNPEKTDHEIALSQVQDEEDASEPHTMEAMIAFARMLDIETSDIGKILKAGGIGEFLPNRWTEMKTILEKSQEVVVV